MTLLTPRQFLVLLLALIMATPGQSAAPAVQQPTGKQAELDASVKELIPQIEKVRGLKFIHPVVARILSRQKDGSTGVQGYYDLKKKTLFLYDDVKKNYWKGVLIHEMVHVLQDQHFGLNTLHDPFISGDAELARAALVEGDATLTMIEVLGKNSYAAKMLAVPLDKSRNLQNAFLYAQGARYVQAIKKRGGWPEVDMRYRFPPQTTAAILHPEERITVLNLGPGKPIGELGLIRLLLGEPATRPLAMQAAADWRGDRRIEEGDARGWVVAFADAATAGRFHLALSALRSAEYPRWKKTTEPDRTLLVSEQGKQQAVLLRGSRVVEVSAPDVKCYQAMIDRIDGPPKLHVYWAKEKRSVSFGEFTDRLLEGDIICVGETHDSEIHHKVQLMIIKALFARDERLGVGMEMFQRPYQKVIDRYMRSAINEATFLEDSEYQKRWGFGWALYRPIVEFCRHNRIPLGALNVSDELRQKVRKGGYDKLTADEKKQLGPVDFHVKEHRAYWFDKLGKMHGHGQMSQESKETFYQIMTIWDEYMADSAARFQKERKLRRLVLLAGSGHIDRGFGIPNRTAKRTKGKVLTVRIVLEGDPAKVFADPQADFVLLAS
jgi:uncharacterized iron-regulated protein